MDNNQEIMTLDELVEQEATSETQQCVVANQDSFGTELVKVAATGVVTVVVTTAATIAIGAAFDWVADKAAARRTRKATKARIEAEMKAQETGLNDEETAS